MGIVETMDNLECSICGIVASIAGVRRVTPSQRLYHDLGLSGDDAAEIFETVSKRYGTEFSGFRFADYFPDESEGFAGRLERWVGLLLAELEKRCLDVPWLSSGPWSFSGSGAMALSGGARAARFSSFEMREGL